MRQRDSHREKSTVPMQHKYITSIERQQKIKEELYLYLLNKGERTSIDHHREQLPIIDPADGSNLPVSTKAGCSFNQPVGRSINPALWLYIRSLLNTAVYTRKT